MSYEQKDSYFVAVKLLLRDGDRLLITHDIFGDWDLPGGRLKPDEFETPLEDVIKRKMNEELGPSIRYEVGQPRVFFRVERNEANLADQKVRIFAVGFEATYIGGEVRLGDHHDKMEWVDIATFVPEDYFTGGWLKGVQGYLALVRGR